MPSLNIVLIEPQIPQNTGNIARTCAATGAYLHLVSPMGFKLDDKKLKRSGLDYWDLLDVKTYKSTEEFFRLNTKGKFYFFTTKAPSNHSDMCYDEDCFLVFGREDQGLNETLLYKNQDTCVRLPMLEEARSLNLSNAVAVATYEVLRQWNYPSLSGEGRLRNYEWKD